MDLIYTNAAKEDIGVLFDYQFDLAFGESENNFECQIQASAHCVEAGSFLYIEGTEYGGIVDSIKVDTEKQNVVYSGRTWHGILAGKVIAPERGSDYYVVAGDANAVLAQLIEYIGLTDIFQVSKEPSDVQIGSYSFRYVDAYTGIRKMLAEFAGKLKIEYKTDVVVLSAVYLADFSKDEEWDASQVSFTAEKNFRPVNHLVCLGGGNLKDRHVIHLFADENGGIQPYTHVDIPVCDEDYIFGTSQQVLFGVEEVAEVYDFSSAQVTENFIVLDEQPVDWASNYGAYYRHNNEQNTYLNVEGTPATVEVLQTEQPEDWEENYAKYFFLKDERYKSVEGITTEEYKKLTSQPSDWNKTYKNYYYFYSDGVTEEYRKVASNSYYVYTEQTRQPTDWATDFDNYYERNAIGGYSKIGAALKVCPEWEANKYYTKVTTTVAPVFESGKYYEKSKNDVYKVLTTKPSDWGEKFGSYYYVFNNGVADVYKKVQGVTGATYELQAQKPSDWEKNFNSYYEVRFNNTGLIYAKVGSASDECPDWIPGRYYTRESRETAPQFASNTYYELIKEVNAPQWKTNTYYTKEDVILTPSFASGVYYEKKLDNYADLVSWGLEKMKEYFNCNSISIDLDLQEKFDIGDIVGATDNQTGIAVWQPITKKVVTIANNKETVNYEIGRVI